jgi:hypothetical protein
MHMHITWHPAKRFMTYGLLDTTFVTPQPDPFRR